MTGKEWVRVLLALAIALAGMLLVGGSFHDTTWCWVLYLLVGFVAGAVAGRGRDIWLVLLAAGAFYPVAAQLGLPRAQATWTDFKWEYWFALTLVGACLVTAGFAVGVLIEDRVARTSSGRPSDRQEQAIGWRVAALAIAIGIVGFGAWVGYSAIVGSEKLVASDKQWPDCGTPAFHYGWGYEAINYDQADDARLEADYPGMKACNDFGTPAGDEVVSSDGVHIAGWYIPAGNGAGPTAPTLVVVPGWQSHKGEVLKYAPPFHDAWNLVLVDLRRQGQSGKADITWGLDEQSDVRAMIDWLERTKRPTWIGVVGNSMGAATALLEAVGDTRVKALILDSMHAEIVTSWADGLEHEQHLPGMPTAWAIVLAGSQRVGQDLTTADPVRNIGRVGDRPVLLIHSRVDILDTPEHSADRNYAEAAAAGVPVELEYCEASGRGHGHVIDDCPTEWATWATSFLAAARGG